MIKKKKKTVMKLMKEVVLQKKKKTKLNEVKMRFVNKRQSSTKTFEDNV